VLATTPALYSTPGFGKVLPESELDEFLSWLEEYEMGHSEEWDKEIERDSQKEDLSVRY
jgi:hypothetical protein